MAIWAKNHQKSCASKCIRGHFHLRAIIFSGHCHIAACASFYAASLHGEVLMTLNSRIHFLLHSELNVGMHACN